ncbi:hypothetical protein BDW02DRAFT_96362 [Decorospora gaudefroyi]|uniref:Uncharacterized protein n=1 Tax=Decorospora gaudefroyi TaxID=184978 RepID=A0A6A5KKW7_9PLEO|nr:hypothetical protein BDW02DRAFT_96362 [Decorospora gaudefroyi]
MFLNILSTLATAALFPTLMHAQSVAPDFQSGRCKFDASVYQFCDGNTLVPLLFVSPLYDDAGKDFMAGTAYIDLSRGQTLEAVVAEQDMRISFETDGVQCKKY